MKQVVVPAGYLIKPEAPCYTWFPFSLGFSTGLRNPRKKSATPFTSSTWVILATSRSMLVTDCTALMFSCPYIDLA